MSNSKNAKCSGYLLIAAGCVFFFAAYFGKQAAFFGIGAVFITMGASHVARAKRA
ncbi:MAG: hypothetical protein KGI95_27595 [Pseudomonas sp.]|nr:hypothetical protein [Pseudomonas sp.]MDE3072464.1 hypothetical protein [Pseudomonadota bacterium]